MRKTHPWLAVLVVWVLFAPARAEVRVESPYEGHPTWLKVQLHCHTTESDGSLSPAQVLQWYRDLGFDAVAITDHNRVTVPPAVPEGLILIPGLEKSTNEGHVVLLGVSTVPEGKDAQAVIDAARALGGYASLAHPSWSVGFSKAELDRLQGFSFTEVFNEVVRPFISGGGWESAVWDYLLSRGERVWGLAVDDLHGEDMFDMARGFVMVNVERASAAAISPAVILSSLAEGNFYATTGLLLDELRVEGGRVTVRVSEPCVFHWQGPQGLPLREEDDVLSDSYEVRGDEGYVRLEVVRERDGATAWVQPFWVTEQ